jgi:ribosome-binding protein aMBF1 (putative translation factor)
MFPMTATVICVPTSVEGDHVMEGSTKEFCKLCAAEVWVAPTTRLISGPVEFVCTDCAPGLLETVKDVEVMPPTRAQREELRRHYRSAP